MTETKVIVIGGGHAGAEAAAASARLGVPTVLITQKKETIGEMSCNPAIGGLGKGHLVREIDALDGLMAKAADASGIQFRVLNRSKGPAVRGPRIQADRDLYKEAVQQTLFQQDNLSIMEATVEDVVCEKTGVVTGVVLSSGEKVACSALVLTTGTFLRGVIHLGESKTPAGRIGDEPSIGLALTLEKFGFALSRLKTGTPPRLDGKTIAWGSLLEQNGDCPPEPLSYLTDEIQNEQRSCFITNTNETTHAIITKNLNKSPIYSGQIEGVGPRYCPSIEDKVVRFADKNKHQIFLEPEGLNTDTVYPNGISTSLPADVQEHLVRSIAGLENVRIIRPGYAIEYDHVDARELKHTLETKKMAGFFMAGQITGTTGYEEAAGQGLIAGINAGLVALAKEPNFIIDRAEGYLGVMIDDLVTKEIKEPYRMFTSRAEYRLQLRADNADIRLTEKGVRIGCVSEYRKGRFEKKRSNIEKAEDTLKMLKLSPSALSKLGIAVNQDGIKRSAHELLGHRDIGKERLLEIWPEVGQIPQQYLELCRNNSMYESYVRRQEADIEAYRKDENLVFPKGMDFCSVGGLSNEARQALETVKPQTLGQAARIPGITPAAAIILLRHVRAQGRRRRHLQGSG
ncbi:MAG: tRNA uridine-5-carboxymethylaminomethyl(34) synthesis enzyme MnmG [Rhodospirillaceae bacterium]|nr:tRNA uridine-5-carboxymethylaminomethyl(34) synthesis enzyme MnmG [Rhodospirillaceae bacterium]OUU28841.1 MAG: tRNA uridine-5-carboxymethylaminomethyl(34) synthesis enzyme MnmG [Candidatus Endolissoclinum sp. TMED37]